MGDPDSPLVKGCYVPGCDTERASETDKFCSDHSHKVKGKETVKTSTPRGRSHAELVEAGKRPEPEKVKAKPNKAKAKPNKAKAKPAKKAKASPKVKKAAAKKASFKKKAAKAKAKKPNKKKAKGGAGSGTAAQRSAAKAAALFPRLDWEKEIKDFKKSKHRELSIELGSPGSAQVTRVRLVQKSYCRGLLLTTTGAFLNIEKKGKR